MRKLLMLKSIKELMAEPFNPDDYITAVDLLETMTDVMLHSLETMNDSTISNKYEDWLDYRKKCHEVKRLVDEVRLYAIEYDNTFKA